MADNARILDALRKLDKDNDAHWTSDGMPRLDTIRLLASDQGISREDVSKVAPEFARSNPVVGATGAATATPVVTPTPAAATATPATAAAPDNVQSGVLEQGSGLNPVQAPPTGPIEGDTALELATGDGADEDLDRVERALTIGGIDVEEVRVALNQARAVLDEANLDLTKAQEAVASACRDVDDLTTLLARLQPNTAQDAIAGYLQMQRKRIDERVAQSQEIRSNGFSAKEAARILGKLR
jgi:hypothetical protein